MKKIAFFSIFLFLCFFTSNKAQAQCKISKKPYIERLFNEDLWMPLLKTKTPVKIISSTGNITDWYNIKSNEWYDFSFSIAKDQGLSFYNDTYYNNQYILKNQKVLEKFLSDFLMFLNSQLGFSNNSKMKIEIVSHQKNDKIKNIKREDNWGDLKNLRVPQSSQKFWDYKAELKKDKNNKVAFLRGYSFYSSLKDLPWLEKHEIFLVTQKDDLSWVEVKIHISG